MICHLILLLFNLGLSTNGNRQNNNTRKYNKKANVHRRARRQNLTKQRREQQLLRLEGGRSYRSGSFGAETFSRPPTKAPRPPRRLWRPTPARSTRTRGQRVKRPPFPSDDADDPNYSEASEPSFSDDIDAYYTEYVPSKRSTEVCPICQHNQPPSGKHRSISRWARTKWIRCTICDRCFHQCCTEFKRGAEMSSFICFYCTSQFLLLTSEERK